MLGEPSFPLSSSLKAQMDPHWLLNCRFADLHGEWGLANRLADTPMPSMALSPILCFFLFEVSPMDPSLYALSASVMLVLAIAASAIPPPRAARTQPIRALRGV
jgi:hypothetical protein